MFVLKHYILLICIQRLELKTLLYRRSLLSLFEEECQQEKKQQTRDRDRDREREGGWGGENSLFTRVIGKHFFFLFFYI